jgi:formylglycine-generating enzyme required for sulfatase activity
MPGISWFAAKAYCEWLSASLDSGMGDYTIRLPTEMEWEYAALYGNKSAEETGTAPMRMVGSFWEWCEDPFVPMNNFPASQESINLVSSPKRSVRGGGSWFDSRVSAVITTRGSLEPNSTSPFVSFRPLITIKDGNE